MLFLAENNQSDALQVDADGRQPPHWARGGAARPVARSLGRASQ